MATRDRGQNHRGATRPQRAPVERGRAAPFILDGSRAVVFGPLPTTPRPTPTLLDAFAEPELSIVRATPPLGAQP